MLDKYLLQEMHARERYELASTRFKTMQKKSRIFISGFLVFLIVSLFMVNITAALGLAAIFISVAFLASFVFLHGSEVSYEKLKTEAFEAEEELIEARNRTIQFLNENEQNSSNSDEKLSKNTLNIAKRYQK